MGTPTTTGENTVHALYWSPSGYSFPAGYESTINGFLTNVSSDSGKPTNVFATDSQYYQVISAVQKNIHYDVHFSGGLSTADAYPSGGCTPDSGSGETYTACVDDAQLQGEVASILSANSLPTGLGNMYMVFFPPNVETCQTSKNRSQGGSCSDTAGPGFCAYHGYYGSSSSTVVYGNITYPTQINYTCYSGQAPNGNTGADSAINFLSHEQNESITDPTLSSWYDNGPQGFEIGDECAFIFGPSLGGSPGSQYDQVIGTGHYYIQEEFSNEDYAKNSIAGCIASEELPTASFTVTTPSPVPGSPTSFDGSSSSDPDISSGIASYVWDFGDGSAPGSGATPSHTYSSSGTYSVRLTVTDVDGWSKSVSQNVVVGPAPTTNVIIPSNGATVSGTTTLDASASNATSVKFYLSGNGHLGLLIGTATRTLYGWIASWNTQSVANGSYILDSQASSGTVTGTSPTVTITVANPTTTILIPSNGATLSGTTTLDASASNATSVKFYLFGNGHFGLLIGTATRTLYGWIASWNTQSVANGSYILDSQASSGTVTGTSPTETVTVHN